MAAYHSLYEPRRLFDFNQWPTMKFEYIAGWLLLVFVALVSTTLSELVVIGGKHPLEATAIAIVFGIICRGFKLVPSICHPGVSAGEKPLVFGIVLLGAQLTASQILGQGFAILAIILLTMLVGFFCILGLAKLFKLDQELGLLLAVGTTICGTSAIAITAPLINAKEEGTSYSVATVALWGLVAILVYPILGEWVHATDLQFGIFAGTAIHSTPQVVGAGYLYSDFAGQTATAVKLVRNCLMAPMAFGIALWYLKKGSGTKLSKIEIYRAFPWFLFGYFLLAALSSLGYFTPTGISGFSAAGKFLVLMGMAAIGLNTNMSAIARAGVSPLVVGLIGSIIVAATSILAIVTML